MYSLLPYRVPGYSHSAPLFHPWLAGLFLFDLDGGHPIVSASLDNNFDHRVDGDLAMLDANQVSGLRRPPVDDGVGAYLTAVEYFHRDIVWHRPVCLSLIRCGAFLYSLSRR